MGAAFSISPDMVCLGKFDDVAGSCIERKEVSESSQRKGPGGTTYGSATYGQSTYGAGGSSDPRVALKQEIASFKSAKDESTRDPEEEPLPDSPDRSEEKENKPESPYFNAKYGFYL